MAIAFKPRRSESAGAVPSAAVLDTHEFVVNLADGRLYGKNSGGAVVELGASGARRTVLDARGSPLSLSLALHAGCYVKASDTVTLPSVASADIGRSLDVLAYAPMSFEAPPGVTLRGHLSLGDAEAAHLLVSDVDEWTIIGGASA